MKGLRSPTETKSRVATIELATKACTSRTCNVVMKKHSRSVDQIEVPSNNTDKSNIGYTPKMARKPSDYALFLKEQTPHVRQRLANERNCNTSEILQANVMKECGKL
eukprot:CCRYP_007585-RA/>CCRYP_007585-RA protein AED:0.27 eAED:0.27 QI:0/0/0/1/0/0/2/0/106